MKLDLYNRYKRIDQVKQYINLLNIISYYMLLIRCKEFIKFSNLEIKNNV